MIYFFINLCIHLLVSFCILLMILHFVAKNKHRRNKKGISFLLPVVLTLIFVFQVLRISAPRVLDTVYIIKNNFQTVSGQVESVGFLNHALVMDGETYYYNPFIYKPEVGDSLKISYTPFAHYISQLALGLPEDISIK